MNSPYQAKDLLPYEPERQQLRMDAVKNFRPYKPERQMLHILTKHHTTRHMIRKLYHRCKTPMRIRTPKSANHNNVSSMNFAESRNWPPCRSKSNVKIRRERDLLAQFRGQLTESARPESSRPESD
jgi:hypothetical protein